MYARRIVLLLVSIYALAQSRNPELPVGLVVSSQGASLIRAGTNLPLEALPGNVLFAGDSLTSGDHESAVFLFCPTGTSQQLAEAGAVVAGSRQLRVTKGRLVNQAPTAICTLPLLVRQSNAAEEDYGASLEVPPGDAGQPPPSSATQDLAAVDAAIAHNGDDLAAHVARAVMLENSGSSADALAEYQRIQAKWPGADWTGSREFEVGQARSASPVKSSTAAPQGRTYALIVGISAYRDKSIRQLQFAHKDAELFARHLRSPRGGGLTDDELTLLTDEKATLAEIRNRINILLALKAGKGDTVALFFAGHGTSMGDDGYILTTESDPQHLKETALPMKEVQDLFQKKLSSVGRVVLYVDVCHAGMIGTIRGENKIDDIVYSVAHRNQIFGMLANRSNEDAYEGPQYGGHGVFSLYLVDALNGAADEYGKGVVDAAAVSLFVQGQVVKATKAKQTPKELGNGDSSMILADLKNAGIPTDFLPGHTPELVADAAPAEPESRGITTGAQDRSHAQALRNFEEALQAGRLLPNVDGSAFTYLRTLRDNLPAREYIPQANRLRVALENRGQRVLLDYLKGDESPPTQADFRAAASFFEAARLLTPESQLLRAREDFCEGRVSLYDKDFVAGVGMLERAARVDAESAYAYNALGIAYLEQARYGYAELAFRDAIERAPYWAYPRYNLALTFAEEGSYGSAEREYRGAIRVAPGYAYVHYSLGVLLHKLGRKSEAEQEYRTAIAKNADRPEPYVGLGALQASGGKRSDAERNYQTAIRLNPKLAAAAHDLGLLYASEKKPDQAIKTWEGNIAINRDFVPSRMSLGKAYRDSGRFDLALAQYQAVLAAAPKYAAASMELHHTQGDQYRQKGQMDSARLEYLTALSLAASDSDRKALRDKLRK
jgi:tetratricopeptide (TPR) repeat protein